MYALVEFQGKQYKAEQGKRLKVSLVNAEPGSKVKIDRVLLVSGDTVKIGTPYIAGASVEAVVDSHGRDKKIIVFKYIPKKDYRRKKGHRQDYSVLKIEGISA